MNAPERLQHPQVTADSEEVSRVAALDRFAVEAFQNLPRKDLQLAQQIAGHGANWGVWRTRKDICGSKLGTSLQLIDIEYRIEQFLDVSDLVVPTTAVKAFGTLTKEGVLVLTRLALLMRLAPTGGKGKAKTSRLKPSSIAAGIFNYWPKIIARAIQRKAVRLDSPGLLACLTNDDVQEFNKDASLRVEMSRLDTLAALGCWTDLPPHSNSGQPTDPSGSATQPVPEKVRGEFQPIPDKYLEEFGPRNLWVIRALGPCLLPLLEDLATHLEELDRENLSRKKNYKVIIQKFIARHLQEHPWLDHMGKPLKPGFPLKTGAQNKDKFQFPPRNWGQIKVLSAILQSAHLFLTLLASPGRIGEVDTFPRSCVITARDGKDYIKGWTYKLSGNLFGDARQFPAPHILVQALGQQARLAEAWIRLPPGNVKNGLPKKPPAHDALWLSLGASALSNAAEPLAAPEEALKALATRIGMDPKPGGINLHPHRLRKTIGRLAGIALFNAPTALKRLFGHKSIEMTLHYILCDKDVQTEAEAVLRELRIMHCAEALEEVREAIASGSALPAHSGAAASRLEEAVKEHEARLATSGRSWKDGSAYDLAYLLTAGGKGWRFVRKDIICAKAPGEPGLCLKNRGEPNTSNCQPGCDNRIVLALARRDVDEIVHAYMDTAQQSLDDGQFDVFYYSMKQLLQELESFHDVKEKHLTDPQLQSLLATYKELD
jgi:hypothetical protein